MHFWFIWWDFFCICAAWPGATTSCMALPGVKSLSPAINKFFLDLGEKAHPFSKPHCSEDLNQCFCMVLTGVCPAPLGASLGFLAVLALSGKMGLMSFASPTLTSHDFLAVFVSVCHCTVLSIQASPGFLVVLMVSMCPACRCYKPVIPTPELWRLLSIATNTSNQHQSGKQPYLMMSLR